jgi:hypothetical protein
LPAGRRIDSSREAAELRRLLDERGVDLPVEPEEEHLPRHENGRRDREHEEHDERGDDPRVEAGR